MIAIENHEDDILVFMHNTVEDVQYNMKRFSPDLSLQNLKVRIETISQSSDFTKKFNKTIESSGKLRLTDIKKLGDPNKEFNIDSKSSIDYFQKFSDLFWICLKCK